MNQDISNLSEMKDFVTSLARGLKVIKAFDSNHSRLTLTEVAKRTDLNRAAARRFLFTLNALGHVESDGKLFWLSPTILELGYAYLASQPIVDTVQPFIEEVSKKTGESCSVCVLNGTDVVYIARHLTHHIMSVSLNVGTRLPAFVTSMGRVLMATKSSYEIDDILTRSELKQFTEYTFTEPTKIKEELENTRLQGYSIVNQELELGLRSIAVPILTQRGQVVAAINVSTQAARISEEELIQRILPSLQSAAKEICDVLPD
ncbi:IclR family transcriptional regulator [Aliamphritea ceti]|uniref:IclR family transcriptional regulator n=1 Tax=Aliamphritea ceti TaxID=1524258 RepID=UPI0021C31244|nr:IclR family transcriptional regulator [Aliamphritea ceti]